MPDNTTLNPGTGGDVIATDDIAGVKHQLVKVEFGDDGAATQVSATNRLPVADQHSQPLTDAQLRATPVPVSGTVTANTGLTQPLTDAQLRATPVAVETELVQPLTDAQLRAAAVPVSGPLTDAQLRANPVDTEVFRYNYPISTLNSSTAQLAAGAAFTGTIESPQDQPSISILLTSDQPITLRVRQFIDLAGTFPVPDLVFYIPANTGFSRSFTINGNFVQLIATNTGASTTTTFNLNTAFGLLGDAESTGTTPVTELPLVLTGAAAQTAIVNNILEPTSGVNATVVSGYRAAAIQVVSTASGGTFIFEQSNDGVNFIALPVFNAALVTGVPITAAITATASQIVYTFPIRCNFLRLRIVSTITGGSIRAFTRLSTEPWTPAVQLVASNTAANLNATIASPVIAAGTNAIGDVGIQYRANATGAGTLTNILCPGTPAAQQIRSGAGRLISIVACNTNAAARWIKIFNLLQGSVTPGTTAALAEIAIPPNQVLEFSIEGGAAFSTGITIMITGAQGLTNNTAVTSGDVTGFTIHA